MSQVRPARWTDTFPQRPHATAPGEHFTGRPSTLGPCSRTTRAGHLVLCVHTLSSLLAPASHPGHLGWSLTGRVRPSTASCDPHSSGSLWGCVGQSKVPRRTSEMAPGLPQQTGQRSKVGAGRAGRGWRWWQCSLLPRSTLGQGGICPALWMPGQQCHT